MTFRIMTIELEREIIKAYKTGKPASEILHTLPFKTTKTIYDVLRRNNIDIRDQTDYKYERDSTYFSKINTSNKAYILGLMITDGWLIKDRDAVGFSSTDRVLTEFLCTELKIDFSHIVKTNQHKDNHQTGYQIQVYDKMIKSDLIRLGFTCPKSFHEFLPYIDSQLSPDLIRGIIDGDVCIHKLSNVEQADIIIYSGSVLFLKQIGSCIDYHLSIPTPNILRSSSIFKIYYSRKDYVEDIGRWIWNGNFCLDRKKSIWEKYCGKSNSN